MTKISMASDWKLWCVEQIGVWMMCDVCVYDAADGCTGWYRDLWGNQLSGTIPTEMGLMTSMTDL
jgi:hypothetical protein